MSFFSFSLHCNPSLSWVFDEVIKNFMIAEGISANIRGGAMKIKTLGALQKTNNYIFWGERNEYKRFKASKRILGKIA